MIRVLMLLALGGLAVFGTPVMAHEVHGYGSGFASGFMHPVLGWDHVAAMVAVGLWGGVLGRPAIWLLPIVFPLAMAFAAALGVIGVPLPFVEAGIAASAVVIGLMIVLLVQPPLPVAVAIVGVFAVFHGHAHGTELPDAVNPFAYALGFVLSTGLLHAFGIVLGLAIALPFGRAMIRSGGALISLAGLGFLFGAI
ncbi:MAG: HupE/UreJ family protein [Pseudomonadota bacterium]